MPTPQVYDRMCKERDSLRDLIADLSAALTDEGPDWSFEGIANLRRRVVEALPGDERIAWLEPYVADGI